MIIKFQNILSKVAIREITDTHVIYTEWALHSNGLTQPNPSREATGISKFCQMVADATNELEAKYFLTLGGNILVVPVTGAAWFAKPNGEFIKFASTSETMYLETVALEIDLLDHIEFETPRLWEKVAETLLENGDKCIYFQRKAWRSQTFELLKVTEFQNAEIPRSVIGTKEPYTTYVCTDESPVDYVIDNIGFITDEHYG